jgi:hypothetical protein
LGISTKAILTGAGVAGAAQPETNNVQIMRTTGYRIMYLTS